VLIVHSRNSVPIRLTIERWNHLAARHPEMATLRDRVRETVEDPDRLQAGDLGEILAIRWYDRTPLTSKFVVVAYRETDPTDGFILTAYLTSWPSQRRTTLWTR
jgi:hypothetical protein